MKRALLVTAVALVPVELLGHHSRAPYDMTREVEIEGTVTKLDWRNPHILLTLEVRGAGGEPVAQEIEVFAVSQVRALGLRREAIEPGEHVVVRARPNRSGPGARALGLDVTADDGTVYPLSTEPRLAIRPPAPPATSLAGQWVPSVESFNDFVQSSSPLPLTDAGRAAQEELMRTWMGTGVASAGICEPFPPMHVSLNPDMRTIEVGEASVVIRYEAQGMNQQRIVHMDRHEHPADLTPSLLGHSIGRWEGDTLVIDTVGMTPHRLGIMVEAPSTPLTHLVERLELADDRRQLHYTLTAEDPIHLQRPVSFRLAWDHRPDLPPSSDACDRDNARRALER